jgi:hypothetical protein
MSDVVVRQYGSCVFGARVVRQVAARYALIFRTAPLQSLRNIGRSISARFIPPVGVVQPTAGAAATAIVARQRRTTHLDQPGAGRANYVTSRRIVRPTPAASGTATQKRTETEICGT